MFGSDWGKLPKARLVGGIVIALAFCSAWMGYGLLQSAQYEREASANTAEYARHTGDKVAEACVGISRIERVRCLDDATDAQREYEYNQADLVAQRQSALWAYIMAGAAILGMVLSAVGVMLVWTTFRETKRTADAALEANEIARSEHRPMMLFEGFSVTRQAMGPPRHMLRKGEEFQFEVAALTPSFRNAGSMPAYIIEYDIRVDYCVGNPTEDAVKFLLNSEPSPLGPGGFIVDKGEAFAGPPALMMAQQFEYRDFGVDLPETVREAKPELTRFFATKMALVIATLRYRAAIGDPTERVTQRIVGFGLQLNNDGTINTEGQYGTPFHYTLT